MFKKLKNLLSIYYSIIRRFLGYKYPINVIPEGLYCYTWIEEIYVICPYFKRIDENYVGCKYLGIISDDLIFNDQCKICNKNLNYISMLDTNILIGSKVHYTSPNGSKVENGILKSINGDKTVAFVVFNCNGDWDNYANYTAQSTPVSSLQLGWDESKTISC